MATGVGAAGRMLAVSPSHAFYVGWMAMGVRAAGRASSVPPAALLDGVRECCRALAAAASGRVFTVPAEGAMAALETEARNGARYDTLLSFMCTPGVASLPDYVAGLERVLATDGWIAMVEPAWLDRGSLRERLTARRLRQPPLRSTDGSDLVSAVRAHGLVVTDVHRREARSVPAVWRQYVALRARR